MSKKKAYILCYFAGRSRLYSSWLATLPIPYEIVTANAAKWEVPDDAAIVISHMHCCRDEVSAPRRIAEQCRVPVLKLADGIVESLGNVRKCEVIGLERIRTQQVHHEKIK